MLQDSIPSLKGPRRLVPDLILRIANRPAAFTITALTVLAAKFDHIHSHLSAIAPPALHQWGYSFFAQDVALLILIRLLLDHWQPQRPGLLRGSLTVFTRILMAYSIALSVISINFYLVTGSEIHWRNIAVATDASSWGLILSGTVSFIIVVCVTLFLGWLLQDVVYAFFGYAADMLNWPLAFVWRRLRGLSRSQAHYAQISQGDHEDTEKAFNNNDSGFDSLTNSPPSLYTLPLRIIQQLLQRVNVRVQISTLKLILHVLVYLGMAVALSILTFLAIKRPVEGSFTFLSWTTGLLPFVDFSSFETLAKLRTVYGTGIQHKWDDLSALTDPIDLPWLPKKNGSLEGFEDWYLGNEHYNANADPMRISNLKDPLHASLKNKLEDIDIRHVIVVLLESTRNDIFPIKKDGLIWNRLSETWPNNTLPLEAQERLANLTPTANYITGDYNDGFEHNKTMPKRGGAHFTNAHTAGTFTLKSMVGALCGVAPLLVDFNLDYKHHIYQPCLPHIFEAMNQLDLSNENTSDPYAASKWQSYFYQTATLQYNEFDKLMTSIGFPENNTIDREYLKSSKAKHGAVTNADVNYFGFEEDPLEDYIRDAFQSAKKNDERVFLTHITSTSHHPFGMPESETYVPMAKGLDDLSHYINAEGYVDKWLKKMLNILDDEKVANETLVIFVGDHGLSMPENDIVSSYYDPSIGADHVPLVLSHPQLPAFDVNDAVHASQILPTVLDILLETGSLNTASHQAASDLVANYEGQSLIRPLKAENETTQQGNWQFTLVNPGRGVLTVRDARYPDRHLVVPVIENVEWRFSDLVADPREQHSVQGFDFVSFLRAVDEKHGVEVAKWVEEGAFMSRWWVEENLRRWRYGLYDEES